MPLANLWRKALKKCISVNKILLRALGVPQTFFVAKGFCRSFCWSKGFRIEKKVEKHWLTVKALYKHSELAIN